MRIACEACDQLAALPPLEHGQEAECNRCGHQLARRVRDGQDRALAFAIAALILLACTLYYPMLGFSARGRGRTMSLLDSGTMLVSNDETLLGVLVLLLVVIVPMVLLTLLTVTLVALKRRRQWRMMPILGRLFFEIRHWNMVEVYVIGVLVSLTKIAGMATVELGIAFWSLLAFVACFSVAMNSIDRIDFWRAVRELGS